MACPRPALAQIFGVFEGLFENVNSIAFYTQGGALADEADAEGTVGGYAVAGLGLEIFLDLPSAGGTEFELGLGASTLGGLGAAEPTLDLRAAVRTLPTLSVYATGFGLDSAAVVQPYVGLQFGVAELWNARGYDAEGRAYEADAETFELGAAAGAYVNVVPLRGLYVEVGYRQRAFESVAWGTEQLPPGWPRALDASAWQATVGWQFRIRD